MASVTLYDDGLANESNAIRLLGAVHPNRRLEITIRPKSLVVPTIRTTRMRLDVFVIEFRGRSVSPLRPFAPMKTKIKPPSVLTVFFRSTGRPRRPPDSYFLLFYFSTIACDGKVVVKPIPWMNWGHLLRTSPDWWPSIEGRADCHLRLPNKDVTPKMTRFDVQYRGPFPWDGCHGLSCRFLWMNPRTLFLYLTQLICNHVFEGRADLERT